MKLKSLKTKRTDTCYHNSFAVHSPFEHPLSTYDFEFIEIGYGDHGMSIEVLITPEVIFSEEYLKEYPIEKRFCMFDGDRRMKFYKHYTQRNCEMDCMSGFVERYCNCTPFDVISSDDNQICSTKKIKCSEHARSMGRQVKDYFMNNCDCWPACNSVKYKIEVLSKELTNSSDEVLINFRFKDGTYTPYRRYQQFQFIDFMSQSGGILGLFAGVSFLSIVELFYLIGMKNVTNIVRTLRRKFKF